MAEILVSTFQRGGSSLVMQMLAAAGVTVAGDYPAYEPEEAYPKGRARNVDHMAAVKGAVKLLEPAGVKHTIKIANHAVWIDRDPKQRAHSASKFSHRFMGNPPFNRAHKRQLAVSYIQDRRESVANLKLLLRPGGEVTVIRFEKLIEEPENTAWTLAQAFGLDRMAVKPMAHCVVKRTSECLPYMLEQDLLRRVG